MFERNYPTPRTPADARAEELSDKAWEQFAKNRSSANLNPAVGLGIAAIEKYLEDFQTQVPRDSNSEPKETE